jgi:hypothetical protein
LVCLDRERIREREEEKAFELQILALQAIFEEGFITLEGNDRSTQAFMVCKY